MGISNDLLYACGELTISGYRKSTGSTFANSGTAFVVMDEMMNDTYVITCRHNVEPAWGRSDPRSLDSSVESLTLRSFNTGDHEGPPNIPRYTHNLAMPASIFVFHPDPTVDVAGCRTRDATWDTSSETPYLQYLVNTGMFVDCSFLETRANIGQGVVFPGFPPWYDRNGGRPILRTGAVVSDPRSDYRSTEGDPTPRDGRQQMLLEAFSFSGSSGSPVFTEGTIAGAAWGGRVGISEPRLLGMTVGHLKDDTASHVGLSRLVKAPAVTDVLNLLRNRAGPPDDVDMGF